MRNGLWFWIAVLAAAIAAIVLLHEILAPFLVGLVIAYLLNPPTQRLELGGMSRTVATSIVLLLFFAVAVAAIVLLAPILETQLVGLVQRLVELSRDLFTRLQPYVDRLLDTAGIQGAPTANAAGDVAGKVVNAALTVLLGVWSGGMAVLNVLSLVFITPVVAFYLLRDWPALTERVDTWLPRRHASVARDLLRQIDERLAGFIRGQALVCLILGAFYAIALTLAGLSYGLVVGLLGGFLAFIPFVGATVTTVVALLIAFFQFGDWTRVVIVAAILLVGQAVEGNILSPKLVGERVGLHPVWLIFALLAGGALFGFTGVLIAVPVAATLGVLARYGLKRYLESATYRGDGP